MAIWDFFLNVLKCCSWSRSNKKWRRWLEPSLSWALFFYLRFFYRTCPAELSRRSSATVKEAIAELSESKMRQFSLCARPMELMKREKK